MVFRVLCSILLFTVTPLLGFRLALRPMSRLHSLSMVSDDIATYDSAQIPLKVAVCGGGVGGMFLGYTLQKKGFDVTVYEKTAQFSRFGGPIQLASNALGCVKAIDPLLFDKIMGRFTFTGTRKCGIKDGIRNSWYNVFDAIKNLADWGNLPYTGVIDRPDLQEIMLSLMAPGAVVNNMPIEKYTENEDGTVDIESKDGQVIKGFDVVVGADGIWSSIRRQMWNEPSDRPGSAQYSGYTLFAAETIMPPDSVFFQSEGYLDTGYKVYIGPNKYFVTSDVGSGRIQWYAFLGLPPGTKARASNRDFVKEQFEGWSPEILACLDNTPDEIIDQRDMYDRRPSVFRSWSKGHVTMLGDAVHPMMPNLGQGGCQALEDAFVLTNLLCQVTEKKQIPAVLQEYYQKRIIRSAIVQGMSRFSSDIIISAFTTPFSLKEYLQEGKGYKYLNPKALGTWYLQPFLPLIFYAQFGYLYSFQPTSFEPSYIQDLVKKSLARNKDELEKVYATLKDGYKTYFTAKTMSFMRYNTETKEISKIADAVDMRTPQ
eukprot:gene11378-23816_t